MAGWPNEFIPNDEATGEILWINIAHQIFSSNRGNLLSKYIYNTRIYVLDV